ncbi:5-(carboxyamino)imidazole ribonucleotide synthase [Consotaella aegiceratis]|uniref:5-(carboxyamino)imidazole ribonucleotide synthase n=1 Tax=Consotaella aegiceratis TaxID=3097961 RepID=UPI002F3F7A92
MSLSVLGPGATIGIVGGGQLGRMLAMAAARLGFRTIVLDPDRHCPAAQTAGETIAAAFDDPVALIKLARRADVVTYEFENVPVAPMRRAGQDVPVYPPVDALEIAQDRVTEKAFLNGIGLTTAPWRAIDDPQELDHALQDLDGPCILKARRFGYDGKGQVAIDRSGDHGNAFAQLGGVPSILEKRIAFVRELSVVAARSPTGEIASFDPAENVHRGGILRTSTVPGSISPTTAAAARKIAATILERLSYVGVIGVELFETADGHLLVNEIAPRVHNSGHWTEAACTVSQFEQHIRAIAGLPLGSTARHSDCVMENLIGDEATTAFAFLAESHLMLHLYGKGDVRPGRKMGHLTRLTGPAGT